MGRSRTTGEGAAPAATPAEIDELRRWLRRTPPQVPPKYFYDERGSDLFEAITRTPEYYPTRTERALLEEHAPALVRDLKPREIAEIGSGSSRKTRLLLDAFARADRGRRCVLFDISGDFLEQSAAALRRRYPDLAFETVVGDFQRDLGQLGPGGGRLVVFLGGTIGNLDDAEIGAFLRAMAARLAPDDVFLLGVDLVKDPRVLEAAYDDAQGVTARFNLNMLRVLNARFGADFDPESFRHRAVWNAEASRIEIWLDAVRPVTAHVVGLELNFAVGEGLRTEISRKFTRASLERQLAAAGLALDRWLTDEDEAFALAVVRPEQAGEAAV